MKYAPGTLAAIALDKSGNEAGRTRLISGEKDPILTVRPDRSVLPPDGQALCFAEIEFTDKSGVLLPYMEQRVDIKIDGNAVTLQGFGSALTKPTKFLSTLIIIHTAEERSLCSAQGKPTANQPSRYLPKIQSLSRSP